MTPLPSPPTPQTDPLRWCIAITAFFALLIGWRLGFPPKIYFDEVHYVNAARAMLARRMANPEHPLLAKELIAAAIATLGDHPAVWRLPSWGFGVLGLFAFGRAVWWASGARFATIAAMILLISDFAWAVQSRIAMLDMVMAGLAMVALWQLAAGLALGGQAPAWRQRLCVALGGLAFGLALSAKWSVLPVAALASGGVMAWRMWAEITAKAHRPFAQLSLSELAFWLISAPLLIYAASFAPAFFYHTSPIAPTGLVAWHRYMLDLQASVVKHHPYQSTWLEWVMDWRGIWYFYEPWDGAQRGILMIGNPVSMIAGVLALGWMGLRLRWPVALRNAKTRRAGLWAAALYLASLGLWIIAKKPVQFYYHYLLPGSFLMACLALALDDMWTSGRVGRWCAGGALAVCCGVCVWFWPILSAAPLVGGPMAFQHWMWLESWR